MSNLNERLGVPEGDWFDVTGQPEKKPASFYRPCRITHVSSHEAPVSDSIERNATSCQHCTASYGHTVLCPTLNRNIAEAKSAVLSAGDDVRLHSLGVRWSSDQER